MAEIKRKKWSQRVTESSRALELEPGVFTLENPREIAMSLKRSAECSKHRKSDPFHSATSVLTFYINRAGKKLSVKQRKSLEAAKKSITGALWRIKLLFFKVKETCHVACACY